jgi:hypothetical protein
MRWWLSFRAEMLTSASPYFIIWTSPSGLPPSTTYPKVFVWSILLLEKKTRLSREHTYQARCLPLCHSVWCSWFICEDRLESKFKMCVFLVLYLSTNKTSSDLIVLMSVNLFAWFLPQAKHLLERRSRFVLPVESSPSTAFQAVTSQIFPLLDNL